MRGSLMSNRALASMVAVALLFAAGAGRAPPGTPVGDALQYRYDATWPKQPLPNAWTFQGITGLYVDRDDVIWVLQRPRDLDRDATENYAALSPPTAQCCIKPPAVMAFDVEGNLLHAWGDPDAVQGWPRSHITILGDYDVHVWSGGATPGDTLLKFTKEGEHVGEFGKRGPVVDAAG